MLTDMSFFLTHVSAVSTLINDSQITISTSADITAKRQALISFIWGTDGFPKQKLPSSIDTNVKSPVQNLDNLERVDTLHIAMDAGLDGLAHHFIPKNKKNRLVVFHAGHACSFNDGQGSNLVDAGYQRTIKELLSKGFSVLAVYMPHYNPNDCSEGHDEMFKLATTGSPMKFFLEPVAVSLNYLKANFPAYQDVNMVGLSGGGWTTTVYAALDPRIKLSFPVAGSIPLYLRWGGSRGDTEQFLDRFYRISGYLDLYVMGSYGAGRRQIQILNRRDDCCFGEAQHNAAEAGKSFDSAVRDYEAKVNAVLRNLYPGFFRLYIDEASPYHMISDNAILNVILPVLNGKEIASALTDFRTNTSVSTASVNHRIYAFARGDNNRIYTISTMDRHPFGGWGNWEEVEGGGKTDAPVAVTTLNGRIYIFAKGINDNRIYVNSAAAEHPFEGWTEVQGNGTTDAAPAATVLNGRIYIFAKGINDNQIYVNSAAAGYSFGKWEKVQDGITTDVAPAATVLNGRIYVFAKGINDNRIYVNSAAAGYPFEGWIEVKGNGTTDAPVAVTTLNGRIYVFAKGINNNRIYVNSAAGHPFKQWEEVQDGQLDKLQGGRKTDTSVGVASLGDRIYVFAKGIGDNRLYVNSAADGYPFVGWSLLR